MIIGHEASINLRERRVSEIHANTDPVRLDCVAERSAPNQLHVNLEFPGRTVAFVSRFIAAATAQRCQNQSDVSSVADHDHTT